MDSTQYHNKDHDEGLRQLFRQLPMEKPPVGFSSRVMEQVMLEAQHAARQSRIHRMVWIVTIPCLLILLTVAGFVTWSYWIDDFLQFFDPLFTSLGNAFSSVSGLFAGRNGSKVILLGVMVLALLLGDLFLRRHAERKKTMGFGRGE